MRSRPSLSIITPTFQEAANIDFLAGDIAEALGPTIPDWELIVVDDNSQDGIAEKCGGLCRQGLPVQLIVRRNQRGLATAVMEGFRHARAPVLLVMDADCSHGARDVVKLYQAVKDGAEFAIGSRYIEGGSTDDKWTVYRYFNSKVASLLASPLVKISDPMSGFFALRRSLLEQGPPLSPVGYKIGLEILIKCRPGALKEIPIHFRTRVRGKSKLSLRQQLLYLDHLCRLYHYVGSRLKRSSIIRKS